MDVSEKKNLLEAIDWLLARSVMIRESFRSIHSSTVVLFWFCFFFKKNINIKRSVTPKLNITNTTHFVTIQCSIQTNLTTTKFFIKKHSFFLFFSFFQKPKKPKTQKKTKNKKKKKKKKRIYPRKQYNSQLPTQLPNEHSSNKNQNVQNQL